MKMKTHRSTAPVRWALALALLLAGAASPSTAEDEAPTAEPVRDEQGEVAAPQAGAPTPSSLATSGVRIFVDPRTGELTAVGTPEQRQRLSVVLDARSALHQSDIGLTPFVLSSGGLGVNLEGRFMSSLVVHRDPDGELHAQCSDLHPDDPRILRSAPAPAAPSRLRADLPTEEK